MTDVTREEVLQKLEDAVKAACSLKGMSLIPVQRPGDYAAGAKYAWAPPSCATPPVGTISGWYETPEIAAVEALAVLFMGPVQEAD